jgi:hypothetical protein
MDLIPDRAFPMMADPLRPRAVALDIAHYPDVKFKRACTNPIEHRHAVRTHHP